MTASRVVIDVAMVVALASGCASSTRREDTPVQAQLPSASHASETRAVEEPSPVERDGLGAPFKTTWIRPARTASETAAAPRGPEFFVSMLGESANAFRVHLQLNSESPDDPRLGKDEQPVLIMAVNGCQQKLPPAFTGLIRFGGRASVLTIARNRLPKGELRLIVRAHGQETSMDFKYDDDGFRPMTPDEAEGYSESPADPAKGEPGVAASPMRENCP